MPAELPLNYPRYLLDLSLAFPTAPTGIQNTANTERPLSALVQVTSYLLQGKKLTGSAGTLTPDMLMAELTAGAAGCGVSIENVFEMAKSLSMPGSLEADDAVMAVIDPEIRTKRIFGKPYQVSTAGWSAIRRGSILNFGCGVGKTLTAILAARTAVKIGTTRPTRCVVIAPQNAIDIWRKHAPDLAPHFNEYFILSCDSAHKYTAMDSTIGGALIIDEGHKGGGAVNGRLAARRAIAMHEIRKKFDWCVVLSATLLNVGPELVVGVQDMALPGLSRVADIWAYGAFFDCIATTDVPGPGGKKQKRRKLVIPPHDQWPNVAKYLTHATRSLDFDSPEVIIEGEVPAQTLVMMRDWAMPEWALGHDKVLWVGSTPWQEYMGALAVAMMYESQEELLDYVRNSLQKDFPDYLTALKYLVECSKDPFFEGDIRVLKEHLAHVGLPNFSRLLYAACREGRVDRVIQQVEVEIDGIKSIQYRFLYPEGSDRLHPRPGVKIQWALQWLADNPDEPLVLGAGGRVTIDLTEAALWAAGISFATIRGGVSAADRGTFEAQFQAGEVRVLLGQEVAASESITLTRANTSILIDHDWKPIPYTQYLGRTRRIGQTRPTVHYDLAAGHPQVVAVQRVMHGREFDKATRDQMETEVRAYL